MRAGAKKRLIAAVVIVALAVIFVPMLFEPASLGTGPAIQESIPRAPAFDPKHKSEVFLGPGNSGVTGPNDSALTVSPLPLPAAGSPATGGVNAEGAPEPVTGTAPTAPRDGTPSGTPAVKPEAATGKAPKTEVQAKAAGAAESAPPRRTNDGMPSWVIQVASVATPAAAAELVTKLRAGGFSAFDEKAEVNGKVYYRVRVGPELDRTRAEQTAARLRERHKLNTLITSYQ